MASGFRYVQNPEDFMKSGGFHIKSGGFHEIRADFSWNQADFKNTMVLKDNSQWQSKMVLKGVNSYLAMYWFIKYIMVLKELNSSVYIWHTCLDLPSNGLERSQLINGHERSQLC